MSRRFHPAIEGTIGGCSIGVGIRNLIALSLVPITQFLKKLGAGEMFDRIEPQLESFSCRATKEDLHRKLDIFI